MSARIPDSPTEEQEALRGESFLSRFHRRKLAAREGRNTPAPEASDPPPPAANAEAQPAAPEPTDADMPPLESLTIDSDFTGFLSDKVSESLRRAALRKLFHSAEFNVVDGLDEYAEDFTNFEALGDIITADMRHRIETEARKKVEEAKRVLLDSGDTDAANDEAPPVTAAPSAEEPPTAPPEQEGSGHRQTSNDTDQENAPRTSVDS